MTSNARGRKLKMTAKGVYCCSCEAKDRVEFYWPLAQPSLRGSAALPDAPVPHLPAAEDERAEETAPDDVREGEPHLRSRSEGREPREEDQDLEDEGREGRPPEALVRLLPVARAAAVREPGCDDVVLHAPSLETLRLRPRLGTSARMAARRGAPWAEGAAGNAAGSHHVEDERQGHENMRQQREEAQR